MARNVGRGRGRSGLRGFLLGITVAASGCAASNSESTAPTGAVTRTGPGAAPQLACAVGERVMLARADGSEQRPLSPQPPEGLSGLAVADQLLVGTGQGVLYGFFGARGGWRPLHRFGDDRISKLPVRVATYRQRAVVWLRGNDPGTVPAALVIDGQGGAVAYPVDVAQQELGGIWQSSNAPLGQPARSFPPTLKLVVAEARMLNPEATETLLHVELSSWGGRLMAPNVGAMAGDWPDAPLYYVGDPPGDTPVALLYRGQPLGFRGLIGYGPSAELLFDAHFADQPGGLLVVHPPTSGALGGKRIEVTPLPHPGLEAPCTFLPAGFSLDGPPPAPPPSRPPPPALAAQPASAAPPLGAASPASGARAKTRAPRSPAKESRP